MLTTSHHDVRRSRRGAWTGREGETSSGPSLPATEQHRLARTSIRTTTTATGARAKGHYRPMDPARTPRNDRCERVRRTRPPSHPESAPLCPQVEVDRAPALGPPVVASATTKHARPRPGADLRSAPSRRRPPRTSAAAAFGHHRTSAAAAWVWRRPTLRAPSTPSASTIRPSATRYPDYNPIFTPSRGGPGAAAQRPRRGPEGQSPRNPWPDRSTLRGDLSGRRPVDFTIAPPARPHLHPAFPAASTVTPARVTPPPSTPLTAPSPSLRPSLRQPQRTHDYLSEQAPIRLSDMHREHESTPRRQVHATPSCSCWCWWWCS